MLPLKIHDHLLEKLNDHFRSVSTKFLVAYRLNGEPREQPVNSADAEYDRIAFSSLEVTHVRVLHADGPLAGQPAIKGLTY